MPSLVSNIGRFHQETMRHLPLYAQAVLPGASNFKIRVNRLHIKDCRSPCRSGRRIREICVREGRRLKEWHNARLAKDDISLGLIVEDPKAAADDGLVIAKRRI